LPGHWVGLELVQVKVFYDAELGSAVEYDLVDVLQGERQQEDWDQTKIYLS
jgi:hypothetical protein